MTYLKILLYALATFMATSTLVFADDDDDDGEIPFAEAFLFFELNDTDGDLGIHGKIDGDEWKKLEIEDPRGRRMLKVKVQGRLKRQGLTELFFESAEPIFDELDPVDFFKRFPEGIYEIEGKTLDGEERENEVYLSHVIPAAPDGVMVSGTPSASLESCEGEDEKALPIPVVANAATTGVTISWAPVTMSHAAKHGKDGLGDDGVIEVRYYEVVVEIDETDFKSTSIVPGNITSWSVPKEFFVLAEAEEGEDFAQYKYEILVRLNVYDDDDPILVTIDGEDDLPLPGNKSAIESCFLVPVPVVDD